MKGIEEMNKFYEIGVYFSEGRKARKELWRGDKNSSTTLSKRESFLEINKYILQKDKVEKMSSKCYTIVA